MTLFAFNKTSTQTMPIRIHQFENCNCSLDSHLARKVLLLNTTKIKSYVNLIKICSLSQIQRIKMMLVELKLPIIII